MSENQVFSLRSNATLTRGGKSNHYDLDNRKIDQRRLLLFAQPQVIH
jgi:hypothetical protein